MSSPTRHRAVGLSLAVSLLLHLLLTLAVRPPPPTPRVDEPKPVELEVVETLRQPPRPAVLPRPSAASPHPLSIPRLPAPRAPSPANPPIATGLPVAMNPSLPAPALEVPPAAAPSLADAARFSATRTVPEGAAAQAEPPDAGAVRGIHAPEVIADPNERVAAMIGAEMGRDKVQRGLVDPYFGELSHALAKKWGVDLKDHQGTLANYVAHLGQNVRRGLNVWQSLAASYGAGGSPLGPTDEPHGAQTQAEAVNDFNRKLREAWKQTKRTLVRITQGPGGLLQGVELVQPSSDPALDAEIIRTLTQGELVLPVPPASGHGIHTPLRSVWAFTLIISISPPIPAVMGSFDEVTGTVDVRLPLDQRIYKLVELVSVD